MKIFEAAPPEEGPSLALHGGAGGRVEELTLEGRAPYAEGLLAAYSAGWQVLSAGGRALDAVCATVEVLENDPLFNAGRGAALTATGHAELDASVMTGAGLTGAVAASRHAKNPVWLARAVMEHTEYAFIVDPDAAFVERQGLEVAEPGYFITEPRRQQLERVLGGRAVAARHGTVGAVAIDREGHLFAGTSTGGTCCKLPGRVGDSPLIGCGCYADSEAGGVSCTGYGEAIMKIVMAKTTVDLLRARAICVDPAAAADACEISSADLAAREAVHLLSKRTHATGGLILLDRHGNPGFAFNTPRMAYGYVAMDGNFVVAV